MKKNAIIQVLRLPTSARIAAAVIVSVLFGLQDPVAFAQTPGPTSSSESATISSPQLDSMVAPIALYPDQLLSQVLVASTYPQDVQAAYQWVNQNSNLQGKALVDAASKQPWDPSVQALVAFPQALGLLAQNINWTTQLGDAFLTQQASVFDAVQRMRQEAAQSGKLQSSPQQTVNTTTQAGQTYIEIQPASPQVVYVPQYDPAAVWGPPAYYPYPAIAYPSTGALIATGLFSFGTGVLVGSLFNGGGWGWYPGWGHHSVYVNRTFIQNNNFNRTNIGRGGAWVHNPNRGGEAGRIRPGTPGVPTGMPNRFGTPGMANRPGFPGAANRPATPGMANRPGSPAIGNRPGAPGFVNRPAIPSVVGRPTVGQTEQRLGEAERRANPGRVANPGSINNMGNRFGGAQRIGPGATPSQRPNISPGMSGRMPQFTPHQGGAQRISPGFGGAQRSMPRTGGGHFGGGRMGGGRRR